MAHHQRYRGLALLRRPRQQRLPTLIIFDRSSEDSPASTVLGGEILPVMDRTDLGVVALDHEPEPNSRLPKSGFERVTDRLPSRLVRNRRTDAIVGGNQNQFRFGGGCVERLAGDPMQKSRSGLLRHGRKASAFGPVPQSRSVAGERQASLDKQANKFVGSPGTRNTRGQQHGRQE
jgi:hypothetical protein